MGLGNRYAMTGTVTLNGDELAISIDGLGSMQAKFAAEILDRLPDGATYDHGLNAALAKRRNPRNFSAPGN